MIPGYFFRPARDSEVARIKQVIDQPFLGIAGGWVNYETTVRAETQGPATTFHQDPLPREQWKYWVVAFDGNKLLMHEFEQVACLLQVDFDIGFSLYFRDPDQQGDQVGWSMPGTHIVEKYTNPQFTYRPAQEIESDSLASLRQLWDLYGALPTQHVFVKSALGNFYDLKRVPPSSGLLVVDLFSIIESLITHPPRQAESLDSINHQVKNKLVLLRKRYATSVAHSAYFQPAPEKQIWKKLYE